MKEHVYYVKERKLIDEMLTVLMKSSWYMVIGWENNKMDQISALRD
jgi:hypothetical protein